MARTVISLAIAAAMFDMHLLAGRGRHTHRTEQNRTEQNRTEQNRTEQNRTEQNRTEQNRTEQNRTEQNRRKLVKTAPTSKCSSRPMAGVAVAGSSARHAIQAAKRMAKPSTSSYCSWKAWQQQKMHCRHANTQTEWQRSDRIVPRHAGDRIAVGCWNAERHRHQGGRPVPGCPNHCMVRNGPRTNCRHDPRIPCR